MPTYVHMNSVYRFSNKSPQTHTCTRVKSMCRNVRTEKLKLRQEILSCEKNLNSDMIQENIQWAGHLFNLVFLLCDLYSFTVRIHTVVALQSEH